MTTYRGDGCALVWPDWYCKVASNIDSAITALFSISARVAVTSSYFSCIIRVVLAEYYQSKANKLYGTEIPTPYNQKGFNALGKPNSVKKNEKSIIRFEVMNVSLKNQALQSI